MNRFEIAWDKSLPEKERGESLDVEPKVIPQEFVMSRNSSGDVVCRFKDNVWVWGASSKLRADFNSWCKKPEVNRKLFERIQTQMKIFSWIHLCSPELAFPEIKPVSWVSRRFNFLREIAAICFSLGIDLSDCSESAEFILRLKTSVSSTSSRGTARYVNTTEIALVEFNLCGRNIVGKNLGINELWPEVEDKTIEMLFKRAKHVAGDNKPTKLIPTKILGNFIGNGLKLLEEVEQDIDNIEKAFLKYWDGRKKTTFRSGTGQLRNVSKLSSAEVMQEFGLSHWNEKYGVAVNHRRSILEFLNELHRITRYLTHAFTGVRASEAVIAPYYCFEYHEIPQFGKAPFFTTRTRKIAQDNYSVPMQWVTSAELEMVIRVAQKITNIFCMQSGKSIEPNTMPLWTTYATKVIKNEHYDLPITSMALDYRKNCMIADRLDTYITQEDLEELWEFDFLSMDFEDKDLQEGKAWPFSSHQFRRSLAVYAARSGMVSLPSLGAQYKHISLLMTALYTRNSSYAKSFIPKNTKGEIIGELKVAGEFQDAIVERSAVDFQEQVIEYKGRLSGVKGAAIQRQKDSDRLDIQFKDRNATELAMKDKRNPMSYRTTPTGGCLRNELCGSYGVDVVLPCVAGCADAIVIREKAEKYVSNLEVGLEYMEEGSPPTEATKQVIELIKMKLMEEGTDVG